MPDGFDPGTASGAAEEVSASELYHENSRQRRHDFEFGRRITAVNNDPRIHKIISHAYKRHPGAAVFPLPGVGAPAGPSFEEVVARRRSTRRFSGEPLEPFELARLLHYGDGITGRLEATGRGVVQPVRAAPSGGALYPLEIYLAILAVNGLEPGIYHYAVAAHALERLAPGDPRRALALATSDAATFERAGAVAILTIMPKRTQFKYGERGYRFALLEAGHVAQNMLLAAEALELAAAPIGGFIDDEIDEMLGIDGVDEASLYLIAIGRPTPWPGDQGFQEAQAMVGSVLEMLWSDPASFAAGPPEAPTPRPESA